MYSALILSHDLASVHPIEEFAHSAGVRTRAISSMDTAEEWLQMGGFDALLVDDRSDDYDAVGLVEMAWESNPDMIGGIFSLSTPVSQGGLARLAGAEVYQPPHALQDIRQMFEILPTRVPVDPGAQVLLVDDLDSPRSIMCSFIQGLGYENVTSAASVEEGLRVLRENPDGFFCIVTDINMPKYSGSVLINEVRNDPQLRHLPVTILTAHGTLENLRDSLVAGASGVLVKPPKKKALKAELLKAHRIVFNRQDPRLCYPEELPVIEDALASRLALF